MEKKTPLYQTHVDMGGKIVEFGGFLMPVQYPTGVIAEHMAVREKAGLFDVSHMGNSFCHQYKHPHKSFFRLIRTFR